MDGQDEFAKSSANRKCQSENARKNDVIIVGAGVAGSALAHTLGKDGRQVHVIERNLTEPDRIVGEVLQPGGSLKLIELGLENCVNGIDAQQVLGYAIYKDGESVRLPFPLENFHSDVVGKSFHHGRFVQKMREKAASLPNVTLEQGTVTSLLEERGTVKGVRYKTSSGQQMTAYAPLTVVCDGCFSSLRHFLCKPKVDKPSNFITLVLENCQLPHTNYAHVILGDPSFMMLYPISSNEVRFLIDVPGQKLPSISNGEMARYLKTVVAPQVLPQLYSAFISSIDKAGIRTMPTSCMPAMPYLTPGALLIGDSLNMRHPITGGGMTAALYDVALLRDLLLPLNNLNDAFAVAKYLDFFYAKRKPAAFTFNVMADVLYKFSRASPDESGKELQQALFDYLSLGHVFSRGLVALISGLNPNPLSLVFYFTAVAICIVGRLLLPVPSPKRMSAVAKMISDAYAMILPIIIHEGVSQVFSTTNAPAYCKAPPVNWNNEGRKEHRTPINKFRRGPPSQKTKWYPTRRPINLLDAAVCIPVASGKCWRGK